MESDIVLYLPEEKILFTGDLVFIGMHPYLADGDASGLRQTLSELMEWPVNIVVPGHGEVGEKKDITEKFRDLEFSNFFQTNLKFLFESTAGH